MKNKISDSTIWLCPPFWELSISGDDSQGGALIHEATHFIDIGDTNDIAGGLDECKDLAEEDPDGAINNGDSYEFFAENIPFLP